MSATPGLARPVTSPGARLRPCRVAAAILEPGWRSTVRRPDDHPSVSSSQRGAVSEVTHLPTLTRSGTYALFFAT